MKQKTFVVIILFVLFSQKFLLFAENSKISEEECLSFDELRRVLPQLDMPFPIMDEPSEFFPDGHPIPNEQDMENAWLHLKAFCESYPEVSDLVFDSEIDEWFIVVNGKKYFWADGRILPEDKKNYANDFKPIFRYSYEKHFFEIPDDKIDECLEFLKWEESERLKYSALENNTFLASEFYGPITEESIREKLVEVLFLGKRVYVHEYIVEKLKAVNNKILAQKNTKNVKAFLKNFATVYGFNWSIIAYTSGISMHGYGLAVDVMPKDFGELNAYWGWEAKTNDEWYLLKLSERWHPPLEVVNAFISEGFNWGGYWTIWDTIHFEFRPELLYVCDFTFYDTEKFYLESEIELMEKEIEEKLLKESEEKNLMTTEEEPTENDLIDDEKFED
ncbi:MAG: M15 family metallopeptidase [Treponemataceae bacterium]